MMQTLQAAEGKAFDAAYVQNQIMVHETAVTLYQTCAEGGDNQALMAYAQKAFRCCNSIWNMRRGWADSNDAWSMAACSGNRQPTCQRVAEAAASVSDCRVGGPAPVNRHQASRSTLDL